MSIFFDFEVGPSGRRFRRAVDGDKWEISSFVDSQCEKLFGVVDIGSLIELSALSICMINADKEVVGFMALNDYPNVPGVDPADWETWIRNMYQRYYMSRNTLFIHCISCVDEVLEYFLDEAVVSVFDNDSYLKQIVLMAPPGCPEEIMHRHAVMKKKNVYKDDARRIDDCEGCHKMYRFYRLEFCPKLRMRRAVEEDNDDIVEFLENKCPRLTEMYGKYYISELIGRQADSPRKIIVAEYMDRALGVMCLNSDINYTKLAASYDLHPYHSLRKATPLEKEQNKRTNTLHTTFAEPILIGKWSPYQNMGKMDISYMDDDDSKSARTSINSKITGKVNFHHALRKSLDNIIYRAQQNSDDYSDKIKMDSPSQSQVTSYSFSIADLLEEDPFDYEIVNIDDNLLAIPEVTSYHDYVKKPTWRETKLAEIKKRRRSLNSVHMKPENKDSFDYQGETNAFMIELLGFQDDIHERHMFDLLEAAFEIMKSHDYCIIKIPCTENTFPLLQHFSFVPTKPSICSSHALYVAHRSAVLSKLRVREAELVDVPQIANLLNYLDGKQTIWTIENSLQNKDQNKAYVFLSGLTVVGVGILEPPEQIDFIRAKFNLGVYHNHKYHFRGHGSTAGISVVKVVQMYPTFEAHHRFFAREMMRLSGSNTLLWLTAYRNKWVAHKANALASAMIPLVPRKTAIESAFIPELKNITQLSRKLTAFNTWFIGRKLTSLQKVDVNTRIVVVGASRTALAFLNTLLFTDVSSYLNFTSVTLVSPNGLPYMRHGKPVAEMMFPRNLTHTDKFLKSVPYTYYVNVVHGTMTEIDRRLRLSTPIQHDVMTPILNAAPYIIMTVMFSLVIVWNNVLEFKARFKNNCCVVLANGGKYYYDKLFLLMGKQYQHPNYLQDINEKERLKQYGYTPPYVRLDVPRHTESDTQIATENVPDNVFIVNNVVQANNAINHVKSLRWQDLSHRRYLTPELTARGKAIIMRSEAFFITARDKIIVYGASIHAYCCLAALLELKIPAENIVFVEPFPPDDGYHTRVPIFCNVNVDQTLQEVLKNLNIKVYSSYYFQSWEVGPCGQVTRISLLSYFRVRWLECSALFYYGQMGIDERALDAINKSGIVYDGGILIDHEFKTKDPKVYAAGTATRYYRRYFADSFRQKHYDSYEVGEKLGTQIRNQLDPLFSNKKQGRRKSSVRFSNPVSVAGTLKRISENSDDGANTSKPALESEVNDEKLPVLKKPITIYCTLPGSLQYLEVRSPGLKRPTHYLQSLDHNGYVMETFKDGYFKIHMTNDYIVDGVTCLSPNKFSLENFKNIYGLSSVVLNNVYLRYMAMKVDDFFEFFRSPWAFFLYNDQCDELFAMARELRPKGAIKGDTLGDHLKVIGDNLSNPSFRFKTKVRIRSKFDHSSHVEAITDYVIEWLEENDVLLPMYMRPSQLAEHNRDLHANPAFSKRKVSMLKMLNKIF